MAFRNHKFSPVVPPPTPVVDEVMSSTFVGNVETPVVRIVPNNELSANLPAPSSYRLSDLLAAGVPLTTVNPKVITTPESELASLVDNVIGSSAVPRQTTNDNDLPKDSQTESI